MSKLNEVPTDDLLSFHDYAGAQTISIEDATYTADTKPVPEKIKSSFDISITSADSKDSDGGVQTNASFWSLEYYQQFFDVDSKDVLDRIIASMLPLRDNYVKNDLKRKPDMYGPFWIAVTLVFTIAISGNMANYLQHANEQYHWKYDFHLVSYAATAIFLYIMLVPITLWALLKWSSDVSNLDGLEDDDGVRPKMLELMCIYGYSLFIYIPVSVLWTIQINWLQWLLVMVAACLSGSVLLFTLMPLLKLSRHKLVLIIGIVACHLLLATGFMLYFFHVPPAGDHKPEVVSVIMKTVMTSIAPGP